MCCGFTAAAAAAAAAAAECSDSKGVSIKQG
jgi:hypothetical protein